MLEACRYGVPGNQFPSSKVDIAVTVRGKRIWPLPGTRYITSKVDIGVM